MSKLNNTPYKISISIVLLGGLLLLVQGFTDNMKLNKFIYLLIGVCTLYVMIFHYRRLYLSFLEETVMPPNVFQNKTNNNNNKKLTVDVEGGYKVIYWSAKPDVDNKIVENWKLAYDNYDNSGVVDVVNNKAELLYSTPVRYRVGMFNRLLDRHIHYRILYKDGILSKIYTVQLN